MQNKLLKKYYEQISIHETNSSFTFHDNYEVNVSNPHSGWQYGPKTTSATCCICLCILFAIGNAVS